MFGNPCSKAMVFKPVLQPPLPRTFFVSSLSDTPSSGLTVSSGVSDKGDIQNVQGRCACKTGLKTTAGALGGGGGKKYCAH